MKPVFLLVIIGIILGIGLIVVDWYLQEVYAQPTIYIELKETLRMNEVINVG